MNNKMNQQLQMEVYVEHGVAKLRYKPKPTKDLFPVEAQEMAALILKLKEKKLAEPVCENNLEA